MSEIASLTTLASPDTSILKEEMFDKEFAEQLILDDAVPREERTRLRLYLQKRGQIHYKLGKDCKHHFLGRYVAVAGLGLQAFSRTIRGALARPYYWDVDMVNAQPTLLAQYCEKRGWVCDGIKDYIARREELLRELMNWFSIDRDEAKTKATAVFFGAETHDYPSFFKDTLSREVAIISNNIWTMNERQLKFLAKREKAGRSAMAYILQTEERNCLMALDEFLAKRGRRMDVLIHDGGLVRKLEGETACPVSLLRDAEAFIRDKTGYVVCLTTKPLETCYVKKSGEELGLIPETTLIDDKYAAQAFAECMGNSLVKDGNRVYVFENGMYSDDEAVLERRITESNLIFRQRGVTGVIVHNYSGMVKKRTELRKMLPAVLPSRDGFMKEGRQKAVGKLLFEDGWYSFEEDAFHTEWDPSIVFCHRVPRKYPVSATPEALKFVHESLFEVPFADEESPALLKHYLMRGLIGDYRCKKSLIAIGKSNSCKGTTTGAFENAFGGFVTAFNPDSLITKRDTNAERDLAFVMDFADSRLAVSSEMKMGEHTAINSNLFKMLVSGGDTLVARRLRMEPVRFTNYAMPILFVNDLPPFFPADDAIRERLIVIQYAYTFVENPNPNDRRQKQADSTLKERLHTPECADAIIHIIRQEYQAWKASGFKAPKPSEVMLEMRNTLANVVDIKEPLEEAYELTGNEEDKVPNTELKEYIKSMGIVMSDTKLGLELKSLGLKTKVWRDGSRAVRGYSGIRVKA